MTTKTANGWTMRDRRAFWTGQTLPDSRGDTHQIMIVVHQPEAPDVGLETAQALHEEAPAAAGQHGVLLHLLVDGERQLTSGMGGRMDLPLEDFLDEMQPERVAQSALRMMAGQSG